MKRIMIFFLVLFSFQSFSQSKWTVTETLTKLKTTDSLYCQSIKAFIQCMFEYNENLFNAAVEDINKVKENYNLIEKNGTISGSGSKIILARSRFQTNKWGAISVHVNRDLYKNGKRKKSVTYNFEKKLIPGKLKEQFEDFIEREKSICY